MEIQLWREILEPYELAVDELVVKFHHLILASRSAGKYSPIEQVNGRVKTISSILMLDEKYPYVDDVVDICVGHGENYDYLRHLRTDSAKGRYRYNPQFLAVILRIADYLDLDKQRTPILWYKMMKIDGFSKEEWEDVNIRKHYIFYSYNNTCFKVHSNLHCKDLGEIYFKTEEDAKYIIDNFKDELMEYFL